MWGCNRGFFASHRHVVRVADACLSFFVVAGVVVGVFVYLRVYVRASMRTCVRVCVCAREREREREKERVSVGGWVGACACVCSYFPVLGKQGHFQYWQHPTSSQPLLGCCKSS